MRRVVTYLLAAVIGLAATLVPATHAHAAPDRTGVVAHRGGMGLWRQNSATAFDRSIRAGYRTLETDVRATADGVLVLWHEEAVWQRCRGGYAGRAVNSLTWRQLSRVRCDGQPIMRLDALVTRLMRTDARRTMLFAETKQRGITDRVRGAAARLGHRLILQSFEPADLSPYTRNCLLGVDPARAFTAPWIVCVGVPAGMATPEFVASVHAYGRTVWAYTVNDQAQMRALACRAEPVDAIITDRPDLLSRVRCG